MSRIARLERQARASMRNTIASVALECDRYCASYADLYDEAISRDGAVTSAVLEILKSLLVMLTIEGDRLHVVYMVTLIEDVAKRAGFKIEELYGRP